MFRTPRKVLKIAGRRLAQMGLIDRSRPTGAQVERLRLEPDFVELLASTDAIDRFSTKLVTTYKAVEYVARSGVPGALVECGVYRGRHVAVMALTLLRLGAADRDIYLYDTFEGMTPPGEHDGRVDGRETADAVRQKWEEAVGGDQGIRRAAGLEEVRRRVLRTGYPEERLHFVKGDVRETLPGSAPKAIALLRLDTDWYESTRHELEHLYELVSPRGVVVVDDYGAFEGSRKAVDEFFEKRGSFPMLFRTDRSERAFLK
jgi:hypothetical protein